MRGPIAATSNSCNVDRARKLGGCRHGCWPKQPIPEKGLAARAIVSAKQDKVHRIPKFDQSRLHCWNCPCRGNAALFFFDKRLDFPTTASVNLDWNKEIRAVSLQTKIVSRSRFIKRRLFAKNEDIAKQKNGISFKVPTLSIIQPGTNDHHCHMGGNDKNTAKWRKARCKPRFRCKRKNSDRFCAFGDQNWYGCITWTV